MASRPASLGTSAKHALLAIGLAAIACTESTASNEGAAPQQQRDGGSGSGLERNDARVEGNLISATWREAEGQIVVSIASAEPLYHRRQCGGHRDQVELEKRVGGSWTPLRDERPRSWPSSGYNLDGRFRPADIGEGCSMPCEDPGDELMVGPAAEYVMIDQMPTELMTVPYHGELRVRFTYSIDAECMTFHEAVATLTID